MRRALSVLIAAMMLVGVVALPASASGGSATLADKILAEADKDRGRYNIIGTVVGAILDSGVETKLALAANPGVEATAFLPTDVAFRRLVADLTGQKWWQVKESDVIPALLPLGIPTINAIVEYHVIPGKVDYRTALSLDTNRRNGTNVFVETLLGAEIGVDRRGFALQIDDSGAIANPILAGAGLPEIGPNNPFVVQADKNGGVNGIIHGISEVLLP